MKIMKNRLTALLLTVLLALQMIAGSILLAPETAYAAPVGGEFHEYIDPIFLPTTPEKMIVLAAASEEESNSLDEFYLALRRQMVKRADTFQITYNGSVNDLPTKTADIMLKLRSMDDKTTSDDADFLVGSVLKIGFTCQYTSKKAVLQYSIKYTDTAAQLKKVNTAVEKALKKLKVTNMNDVAKVKAIHDYIIKIFSYDQTLTDHSVYGGLIDKKHTTVCQGYSLLTYKMLTDAGLEAHYVTGWAGENHAWNLVKVDGKWYIKRRRTTFPISDRHVLNG